MGVILKHITEPAPRLLAVKADLPEALEAVITRSMEKNATSAIRRLELWRQI